MLATEERTRHERHALAEPKAGRGDMRIAAPFHPSVPWFFSRPTHVMVDDVQNA
jgi:hypothetical protein